MKHGFLARTDSSRATNKCINNQQTLEEMISLEGRVTPQKTNHNSAKQVLDLTWSNTTNKNTLKFRQTTLFIQILTVPILCELNSRFQSADSIIRSH